MKKLAITMGDPGGIGPEIILKAINSPEVRKCCAPIVIGDESVMEEATGLLKHPLKLRIIKSPKDSKPAKGLIEVIEVIPPLMHRDFNFMSFPQSRPESIRDSGGRESLTPSFPLNLRGMKGGYRTSRNDNIRLALAHEFRKKGKKLFEKNVPTSESGRAAASCIQKAVQLALNKQVDGIVTAPISKEALKMAGLKWPGHTEMLAALTGTKDYAMMLIGGPLRVILVTIHTALRNVPDLITRQKIVRTIRLAKRACEMLGIKRPRIAVAGLNPHAGETGIFGDEEIRKIIPAVREAVKGGIPVSGPHPPDTIFHRAYSGDVDIIVCMYHDQGLIPLKMIAFEKGVNVTVGLPFIRTSPDHGTAYDIAWRGIADPSSMIEAIKLAAKLKV
jgi:4-hydroxythreonine-4-phosphate dehydrogenase